MHEDWLTREDGQDLEPAHTTMDSKHACLCVRVRVCVCGCVCVARACGGQMSALGVIALHHPLFLLELAFSLTQSLPSMLG